MANKKLWSGRFTESMDKSVEAFSASVDFDKQLAEFDIAGSKAHADMLHQVGVLTSDENQSIQDGLEQIRLEIKSRKFDWSSQLEDVHMNIESRLTEIIGDNGKKLHTGRSRNDQVATDFRLYVRQAIDDTRVLIQDLQENLLQLATTNTDSIMPGFTHMQVAQPLTFGHHLLAWFEMLQRDRSRLTDCRQRLNYCPLGAAALAGTTFPIDRQLTATALQFEGVAENSMDAVSDRDFAVEFNFCCSLLMLHLSRMCEELILWTSSQFDFIELGDAFCSGSSIMPQKKNPDVAELIRGKSGRVFGNLSNLMMLMKSQPLTYNRDMQEDKEPIFDSVDTVQQSLIVFSAMVPAIKVKKGNMETAAGQGYSTATDLAEYLVRKNIPFRDAHEIVGKSVQFALQQNLDLSALPLQDLKRFCSAIEDDVFAVLTVQGSVQSRNHLGGTAPEQVKQALERAKQRLQNP